MPIEYAMARAVISIELVRLAVLLELGFMLIDLFWARRTVIIAGDTEQRAAEIICHVDRRNGRLGVACGQPRMSGARNCHHKASRRPRITQAKWLPKGPLEVWLSLPIGAAW